jgi:hypothetical protein
MLAGWAFILSSNACGKHAPIDGRFPMTGHLTNRLANFCASLLLALLILSIVSAARADSDDGIVRVKSAVGSDHPHQGRHRRPSTLLVFGNPPLGTQFITSNPNAGLDWPVRLLLTQDDNGDVWAVWTDFGWIAKRHNIRDRTAQFEMATKVVGSITSTITTR